MWKNKHSILLSRISVFAFMAVDAVGIVCGYWIINWFIGFSRAGLDGLFVPFAITCYLSAIPVTTVLVYLNKLLKNISADQIFIYPNVKYIRICSWCCIATALVCFASGFYYYPFFIVSIAAAFMGLILRVIKNVFNNAILLKEENDLTI